MIVSTGTNVGKVREVNEDSFSVLRLDNGVSFLIIADGMGGHKAGQVASATACSIISEYVKDLSQKNGIDDINAKECLENAITQANKQLYSSQLVNGELSGMGTTVVATIITDKHIHVCSAGDSRLYVIKNSIEQITKDHSYVQDLLDKGLITEQEALIHPNKNIITRAVGTELTISTDYFVLDTNDITKLIMCTDGLTNFVTDSEIERILKNNSADEANRILIELANKNGGKDNITVVNVDFEEVR